MKKIILLLIAVLIIPSVLAQDLEISIVSYSPEDSSARLRLYNPTDINYNDVKYSIDNQEEIDLVQRLASKVAISFFPSVAPGTHTVTITSSNGLNFEKTLKFGSTETQVKEKQDELDALNQKQLEILKPQLEQEIQDQENAKKYKPYYILGGIILAIIIIIYYFLNRLKK